MGHKHSKSKKSQPTIRDDTKKKKKKKRRAKTHDSILRTSKVEQKKDDTQSIPTISVHCNILPVSKSIHSLSIAVFGCLASQKYADQIQSCIRTWISHCNRYEPRVNVRIFVGEIPDGVEKSSVLIPLHCGDDYSSATPKHWFGLKFMHDHFDSDFYYTCGTDTFLNIANALKLLEEFNPAEPLYIGGHGDDRTWKNERFHFHSGGPGYFYSRAAMKQLLDVQGILAEFATQTTEHAINYCDVQAGWKAKQLGMRVVNVENKFFNCNHKGVSYGGSACCRGKVDPETLVACHQMSAQDFVEYSEMIWK